MQPVKFSLSAPSTTTGGIKKKPSIVRPKLSQSSQSSRNVLFAEKEQEVDNIGKRQLITHIEENSISTIGGQDVSGSPLVIPLIDATDKTVKESTIETDSKTEKQHSATVQSLTITPTAVEAKYQKTAYGLQVMKRNTSAENLSGKKEGKAKPLLLRNRPAGLDQLKNDEERFKHDLSIRPESAPVEVYEKIPVEEFGAALLRGMGWKDGESVGKNGIVAPAELKRRPDRLGLGAKPAEFMPPPAKKSRNA